MSLISKIVGFATNKVAKYTGKNLKYTKVLGGIPVTHYVKTGTETVKLGGVKTINLGKGNPISQYASQIITYPKGFFGNSKTKTIAILGAKGDPICFGSPKQVGAEFKDWKDLVDSLKLPD